jgi:TPR repeat protein
LGNCYYYSRSLRDIPKALEFYLKAADTGNFPFSCQAAARIYRTGAEGVPQNFELSEKYFKLALEKIRDPVGRNLIELGDLYNFQMQDYEKAVETYQKAVMKGNDNAMFNLANLYLYGKGVAEDEVAAYSLFLQAADTGHVMACMIVSKAYLSGIGLPSDVPKSVQYLEVAARSSSEAQLRLGFLYLKGPKSICNVDLGIANFEKSAEQNNSKACFELAKIYYDGLYNVKRDLEKAKSYYERAGEAGKFPYIKNRQFDFDRFRPTEKPVSVRE